MFSTRFCKIGCVLFLFFVCPVMTWADEGPPVLTLDESIRIALEQNLQIRSAQEELRGARAARQEAFTSFLPSFSTTYGYRRLSETPTARVLDLDNFPPVLGFREAPVGTRDNYTWSLEVTQPLFSGGAISGAHDMAATGVDISSLQQRLAVQDVVLEVRDAYFTILKAERVVEVAQQSVELLEAHRKTAESFYDVGLIPRNDLLYAEVELAGGIQNLTAAENALELSRARFNTVLRRPVSAPLSIEDVLVYQPFEQDLDQCTAMALSKRWELEMYELQVRQTEQAVGVAKSGYYPSVSVTGNYSRYGDDPGVSGSPYKDQEDWYLMAVAKWNFWEWGKTRHGVTQSLTKVEQARNALERVRDLVSLEVKRAYLNLREAEKRIFVARKAIIQAEENFRLNVERYQEQVGTTTDVVEAQALLTRTRSDYFNSLSNYNLALGELERSMGTIWETDTVESDEY